MLILKALAISLVLVVGFFALPLLVPIMCIGIVFVVVYALLKADEDKEGEQ